MDHWIAFGLLAIIGGNMIRESFHDEECPDPSMGIKAMLLLAVATSIDALAVGISFAFLQVEHIWLSCGIIGIITCVLSIIGIKLGSVSGVQTAGTGGTDRRCDFNPHWHQDFTGTFGDFGVLTSQPSWIGV